MATDVNGRRILVISTNYGTETDEIVKPIAYFEDAGATVTVATAQAGKVQTLVSDKDPGPTVESDTTLDQVSADSFDAVVVPGGTLNADALRVNRDAQALVKAFAAAGKPVAAICHAPWLLVESDLVVGKTLTSFHTLRTDVNNAGGSWVDQQVVVDEANGFPLVTSRQPDDLDAFNAAIAQALTA